MRFILLLLKVILQFRFPHTSSFVQYWLKVQISWTCFHFINNGIFKSNGKAYCVARFVLES